MANPKDKTENKDAKDFFSGPYQAPAAGRGALLHSMKHLMQEKAVVTGGQALLRMNQVGGFDCPGCAWPEPENRSAFEFCENGVKAIAAESTTKKVDPAFFARHTVAELAQREGYWLEQQGRITQPMRYDAASDRYVPCTYAEAFAGIAARLKSLSHPDEAIFYTSGRTSNEAAFMWQLFARAFGTNNLPDCSNMCHESSGAALNESVGVGKGTVTLHDFELADLILVIGQNPGTNHPRMLSELQKARKRGCTIIAVNPLKEKGLTEFIHPQDPVGMALNKATPIASIFLQPLVAGDFALLWGMMKAIFEAQEQGTTLPNGQNLPPGNALDTSFLAEHTQGLEPLRAAISATPWAVLAEQSGISEADMRLVAGHFMQAKAVIACWAMGLTQNKHAVATIQQLVNLMLLRGHVGKPGSGLCPVRGHSNVQGDRTMGIDEKPKPEFLAALQQVFGIAPPHHAHGYDAVGAIEAMHAGQARVFIGMGGNFAAATPDTAYTEAALRKTDLTVHITTKLNRSHIVHGREAYVLPTLGRSEIDMRATGPQEVTVEDSMSLVHASRGRLAPPSPDVISETAIVCGLAVAVLGDANPRLPWRAYAEDYRLIRDAIAKTLPGFENFNAHIADGASLYLGNSARERAWKNGQGKALLVSAALPVIGLAPGRLRLMTLRSHDQYNTTVYGEDDRYRGVKGERRVVFMHADDLAARGLHPLDAIDIVSFDAKGSERLAENFKVVAYDIPRGCAAAYFPETNVLVPIDSYADKSRTPTSKFIEVEVRAR
jgi:molybdopterin-dependent oxidoreductase alpha subunit